MQWCPSRPRLATLVVAIVVTTSCIAYVSIPMFTSPVFPGRRDRVVHVCVQPHTHVDPSWKRTFRQYAPAVDNILERVLWALWANPDRTFVWADTAFLHHWLQRVGHTDAPLELWQKRTPGSVDAQPGNGSLAHTWSHVLAHLVREGQWQWAGSGWVQHDDATTTLSAAMDQLTLGHSFVRSWSPSLIPSHEARPSWVPHTAYHIDSFGYAGLSAALWREAGATSCLLNRVSDALKLDLVAQGARSGLHVWWKPRVPQAASYPVDTRLWAHVLSGHYSPHHSLGLDPMAMPDPGQLSDASPAVTRMGHRVAKWALDVASLWPEDAGPAHVLLMWGDDMRFATAHKSMSSMEAIMAHVNANTDAYGGVHMHYCRLPSFLQRTRDLLSPAARVPTWYGDHFPLSQAVTLGAMPSMPWSGFFTTRPALKRAIRVTEASVRNALALAVAAGSGEQRKEADATVHGWSQLLLPARRVLALNMHHDALTGTCTRQVTLDSMQKLEEARATAVQVSQEAMGVLLRPSKPVKVRNVSENDDDADNDGALGSHNFTCHTLQGNPSFVVALYNGLSWPRHEPVALHGLPWFPETVVRGDACGGSRATDSDGDSVAYSVQVDDSVASALTSVWIDAHVPPMGHQVYTVVGPRSSDNADDLATGSEPTPVTQQPRVPSSSSSSSSRRYVRVAHKRVRTHHIGVPSRCGAVVSEQGFIASLINADEHHALEQQLLAYHSGGSGAYVFQPELWQGWFLRCLAALLYTWFAVAAVKVVAWLVRCIPCCSTCLRIPRPGKGYGAARGQRCLWLRRVWMLWHGHRVSCLALSCAVVGCVVGGGVWHHLCTASGAAMTEPDVQSASLSHVWGVGHLASLSMFPFTALWRYPLFPSLVTMSEANLWHPQLVGVVGAVVSHAFPWQAQVAWWLGVSHGVLGTLLWAPEWQAQPVLQLQPHHQVVHRGPVEDRVETHWSSGDGGGGDPGHLTVTVRVPKVGSCQVHLHVDGLPQVLNEEWVIRMRGWDHASVHNGLFDQDWEHPQPEMFSGRYWRPLVSHVSWCADQGWTSAKCPTRRRMSLAVAQSVGVGWVGDRAEVMVHRRLAQDDQKGLDAVLDDRMPCRSRFTFSLGAPPMVQHQLAAQVSIPLSPWLVQGDGKHRVDDAASLTLRPRHTMFHEPPEGVHIVSLHSDPHEPGHSVLRLVLPGDATCVSRRVRLDTVLAQPHPWTAWKQVGLTLAQDVGNSRALSAEVEVSCGSVVTLVLLR